METRLRSLLRLALLVAVALALLFPPVIHADPVKLDAEKLPPTKRTLLNLYLISSQVPSFLANRKGSSLFIDVRTHEEASNQGTPAMIDANIPFEFGSQFVIPWGESDISVHSTNSPGFGANVMKLATEKGLGKNTAVVLISNHGERSAMAANMLAWHGFSLVYSVVDGYEGDHVANRNVTNNGWVANRLPIKRYIFKQATVETQRTQ